VARGTVRVHGKGNKVVVLPLGFKALKQDLEVYLVGRDPNEYLLHPHGHETPQGNPRRPGVDWATSRRPLGRACGVFQTWGRSDEGRFITLPPPRASGVTVLRHPAACRWRGSSKLNEENVRTPRGGRWHSPGVKRALSWIRA